MRRNAQGVVRDLALLGGRSAESGVALAIDVAERIASASLGMVARQGRLSPGRMNEARMMIETADRVAPELARQAGNVAAGSIVLGGRMLITVVRTLMFATFTAQKTAREALSSPGIKARS